MISSALFFFAVTGKRQLQTEVLATDAHGSILHQKNPLAEMAVGNSLALARREPEVMGGEPQGGGEAKPEESKDPITVPEAQEPKEAQEAQEPQAQETETQAQEPETQEAQQEAHNARQAHDAEAQQSMKITQDGMPTNDQQTYNTETQMSQPMMMQPPSSHQQAPSQGHHHAAYQPGQQGHHAHHPQHQLVPQETQMSPQFSAVAHPAVMPGVVTPGGMPAGMPTSPGEVGVAPSSPAGGAPPPIDGLPEDQKQTAQAAAQSSPIAGIVPNKQLSQREPWKCDITHDQSPVDLPLDADTAPPEGDRNFANHFFYDSQSFPSAWFVNNGRALTLHTHLSAAHQADVKKSMAPKKGSFGTAILPATTLRVYNLNGIRLHFPSEHSVAGRFFAGEIHLVHQSNDGKELIVSILVDPQVNKNGLPRLEHFIHPLATVPRVLTKAKVDVNIETLHQIMMGPYWRYHGSSTVPPCEPADWIVFRTPIGVDVEILKRLANALPATVNKPRVIHPLGNRKFYKNLMDGAESLKVSMALFVMIAALWI